MKIIGFKGLRIYKVWPRRVLEKVMKRTWLLIDRLAGLGQSGLLTPPLSLECVFHLFPHPLHPTPTLEDALRVLPWESNVLLKPSGWYTWLRTIYGLYRNFEICWLVWRSPHFFFFFFCLRQTSSASCFWNCCPPTRSGLLLLSFLAPGVWGLVCEPTGDAQGYLENLPSNHVNI